MQLVGICMGDATLMSSEIFALDTVSVNIIISCFHGNVTYLSQVNKVNLSKEESLTILELGGSAPELLANETLMSEGQVIRSSTNQVQIHYRSLKQANHGVFSFHYQGITSN